MKKSREQIISDYDTRNLVGFFGGLIWFLAIGIIIYLELSSIKGFSVFIIISAFIIAALSHFLSMRCPICDTWKSRNYFDYFFIFRHYKWSYSCQECQLTEKQITEYFDLLVEGKNIELEEFRNLTSSNQSEKLWTQQNKKQ